MEDQEQEENKMDVITVDVPLFIRLLEFAREDATDDMMLHDVAERLIKLCQDGDIMTMEQYDEIVDSKDKVDTSNMNAVEDDMQEQNKNMNAINEQRWLKLAGIINENEVNEATEASAWLVDEENGLPKIIRFASVKQAKDNQIDDMADNPRKRSLFTSLTSLADYLEKAYDITNVEPYRYLK